MSEITIYNASAGSGKTYTLTREYISLLFNNIYNYQNILAVTFTNKAAEEMKIRILKELYLLANNTDKADHTQYLLNKFKLSQNQLSAKANLILSNILHDYSNFSVGTIDSFFQQVIRAFTKEIGLQTGFVLELDTSETLDKSVDLLINKIDDDKFLRNWLVQFSEQKIKNSKSWNFKNDIIDLGKEIFKENFTKNYKELAEKTTDSKFFTALKKKLKSVKEKIEEDSKLLGEKAFSLLADYSLEIDDFPYKTTGFAGVFYKFSIGEFHTATFSSRFLGALESQEKWYSKSSKRKNDIIRFYENGGYDLLKQTYDFYTQNIALYNTAVEVLVFIDSLALITSVYNNIHELLKDENKFLLAFAGTFIKEIIKDTDTPFLYEKIGSKYKYFMIDEFQDTSAVQWDNFYPLIKESIANNNRSIIVGDVKQSIYRWRNGDWKLLAYGVENAFKQYKVNKESLKDNWRSKKEIISFNNNFFKKAVELLQNNFNETYYDAPEFMRNMLKTAYTDLHQYYPTQKQEKDKGFVQVEFFEQDTYKEDVLAEIPKVLEKLQDLNYKMKDVCILVRGNTEGAEIMKYLSEYSQSEEAKPGYNYNVISNEALLLNNSSAVQIILAVMRDIYVGDDDINTAFLKYEYELSKQNEIDLHTLLQKHNSNLPKDYNPENLKLHSLYELTEKIISIFELNKDNSNYIYLQAFKDKILEYTSNNNPDYFSFINWWEKYGANSSVKINEEQDAVKIITIHKSKGLEFETVILPASWKFRPKSGIDILWVEFDKEPFNELKTLPVKFTSKLKDSIASGDFYLETIQNLLDNLNLMYVAYTRAKSNLFIFSEKIEKKEKKEPSLMSKTGELIQEVIKIPENNIFTEGKLCKKDKQKFIEKEDKISNYISRKSDLNVKIKSNVQEFYSEDRKKGIAYHKILENVKYIDDIKKSAIIAYNESLLSTQEIDKFVDEIKHKIKSVNVEHWFDGTYNVKNEITILTNNEQKRPDRVMQKDDEIIIVDYKFGKEESKKYQKQLQEYSQCFKDLGYKNIKAYIWYVMINKLEKVL